MPHSRSPRERRTATPPRLNVLVAPDKFKGTLAARAAAEAIARGWRRARPADEIQLLPITDGGDGFGAAIGEILGAREQTLRTLDAAHRPTKARWWWKSGGRTAVVESARVIGLAMLPPGRFHPFDLDTFGLGTVLARAFEKGARRCLIGLGGSATNDGGFGMARALGWRFVDRKRQEIKRWTDLGSLAEIRPPVRKISAEVIAVVDVQNPLLGQRGATRIYGPQKGIRPQDYPSAERCLRRLARVVRELAGKDLARHPGAGAAGGLGFGLLAFAGASLAPGFELFAEEAGLDAKLRWTDLVLTGEGSIDESTLMGKGVGQLAAECRRVRNPCLGFGGVVHQALASRTRLFAGLYALSDLTDVADAKKRAAKWLEKLATRAGLEWCRRLELASERE